MNRPADPPLLTAPFLRLVSGHFLQAVGYSSMMLVPVYATWLGASRTEVGTLMAVGSVGGLLLRPVVGWALDAVGRKLILLASTLVLAVGMGLIAFSTDMGWVIYTARLLTGIGAGSLFAAYFTWVTDHIPAARRTEGIAIFGISGLLPLVVNPVAELVGVQAAELRWFFPMLGVLVLVSILPVFGLKEAPRIQVKTPDDVPWARALTTGSLWPVWWATIVFAGLVAVFNAFATVVATNRGIPHPANLWFGYAGAAVCVRLFGPRLPARLGPRNFVAPALGAYSAACLVIAGADSALAFLVAGALGGFGHGYCFPVLTGQVVDRTPPRLRGASLAVFTALWEGAAVGLTPLFGAIADRTGDAAMFSTAALAATLGLVLWVLLEGRVRTSGSG